MTTSPTYTTTFFTGSSTPVNPFSTACVCKSAAQESQTLINTLYGSSKNVLNDIAADTSACSADDWTGQAAELFRIRVAELSERAVLNIDGIDAALASAYATSSVTTAITTAVAAGTSSAVFGAVG